MLAATSVPVLSSWQPTQHMPFLYPVWRQRARPRGPGLLICLVRSMMHEKWLSVAGFTLNRSCPEDGEMRYQIDTPRKPHHCFTLSQDHLVLNLEGHRRLARREPGRSFPSQWETSQAAPGSRGLRGSQCEAHPFVFWAHWSVLIWLRLYEGDLGGQLPAALGSWCFCLAQFDEPHILLLRRVHPLKGRGG